MFCSFQITKASCLNLATQSENETKWLFPKNLYVLQKYRYSKYLKIKGYCPFPI